MTPYHLALTATVPGLLQRGSPVIILFSSAAIHGVCLNSGLIAVRDGGVADIYNVGHSKEDDVRPEKVHLDLSCITGRIHAGLWLTSIRDDSSWATPMQRLLVRSGACKLRRVHRAGRPAGTAWADYCCGTGWVDWGQGLSRKRVVPALAGLDPDDSTILPDGTRRVDALGLLEVCNYALKQEMGRE